MSINPNGPNNYSAQQLQIILTEFQMDPYLLGYDPYLTSGNSSALASLINWLRDGINPSPVNTVLGPSGTISGATNVNPIVITTAAPHGLANGDAVAIAGVGGNTAANGFTYLRGGVVYTQTFFAKVLSTTTFSLYTTPALSTGIAGNGAYTSGGTWQWLIGALVNGTLLNSPTVNTSDIGANVAISDCSATTAPQGTQGILWPLFLGPNTTLQMTNAAGVETTTAGWVNALTATGTASHKNVRALEARSGSRGEQILNLINQLQTGVVISQADAIAAINGHY